jgi:hypothetical protein
MMDGMSMATKLYPDAKSADPLADGLLFQRFVADQIKQKLGLVITYYITRDEQYNIGESPQGFEVKLDNRCTETGRLSIEVAEKICADNAQYVPSGILRQDNATFYVQGNRTVFYIFKKSRLVELYEQNYRGSEIEKLGTIKTFYLPLEIAERDALLVIHP